MSSCDAGVAIWSFNSLLQAQGQLLLIFFLHHSVKSLKLVYNITASRAACYIATKLQIIELCSVNTMMRFVLGVLRLE